MREIGYLHRLNEVLERRAEKAEAPAAGLPGGRPLGPRPPRRLPRASSRGRSSTTQKQFDRVTNFFQRTAPELVERVELYKGKKPLFEKWEIDEEIESTLSRRVDLPSGGYLMIDYAEALTVIDVNSGSFTGRGKGGLEETITKVNTEAAEEAVRQLRLRDIGGIIVIDFIDMARARNRDKVLKTLRKALDADKSKSYVVEVSPLGLVEMTRQNVTDGVREILTKPLPDLRRRGRGRSRRRRWRLEGVRKLRDIVAEDAEAGGLPDPGQPEGRRRADSTPDSGLAELEEETGKQLPLRGRRRAADRHLRGGRDRAAARRSRSGRCRSRSARRCWSRSRSRTCTTPTTRSPGSTPTSSASPAAARYVGERKLVRIDEVERSAAVASLLGGDRQRLQAAASEDGGERLESAASAQTPRRGRRGGQATFARRRRSKSSRGRMSMYAVVESGGKQYKVEKGTSLLVDRLTPRRATRSPCARCCSATRRSSPRRRTWRRSRSRRPSPSTCAARRSRSSNTRPKKGYRRRAGHRSELTRLEVTDVKMLTRKPAAKAGAKKPAKAERREEADGS